MSDFSKFKIGSTSYDVKDANAGRSLSFDNNTRMLSLNNAAGTGISTVNIPGGGGGNEVRGYDISYTENISPDTWDDTGYTLDDSLFIGTTIKMDGTVVSYTSINTILLAIRSQELEVTFQFLPSAYYSLAEMYFKLSGYWENTDNTYTVAFDMPVVDSNGSKVLFQIEIRYDGVDGSIVNAKAYKYTLGGGGSSIDKYDVKRNGNLLYMSSFIGSSDCELVSGITSLTYSDLTGVDGPWLLNFADGQILITGKNDNNQELYCAVVKDSVPKFVTLVNSWGTSWNIIVANV